MAVRDATKTLTKASETKTLTKTSEKTLTKIAPEVAEPTEELFSQKKRPDQGRYLLQVDRQTKSSYADSAAAAAAGLVIKTKHPVVQVKVYDAVDCVSTAIELPAK